MKPYPALLLAIGLAAPAAAAADTPLALYTAGQYSQAEAAGLAENDAEGFEIAARAVLADEQMRDAPCLECIQRAEDLSRKAIAADPTRPEGHIYLAVALGYEARVIGNIAAQTRNYANVAKRELDAAIAADPKDPWTLAALGSWHIEIVRNAGSTLGRWLFGARLQSGLDYYSKAFAIAPSNLVLRYQYALSLAAFDLSAYRKDVEDQLGRAVACAPQSKYEAFARARAQQLLDVVKRGDTDEVRRLVHRDQGYPA
jgi:hypothetical protein